MALGEIPRFSVASDGWQELVARAEPVIFTDSGFVDSAVRNWSLPYLAEQMGDANEFTVFASPKTFLYTDHGKAARRDDLPLAGDDGPIRPPTPADSSAFGELSDGRGTPATSAYAVDSSVSERKMTFREFVAELDQRKERSTSVCVPPPPPTMAPGPSLTAPEPPLASPDPPVASPELLPGKDLSRGAGERLYLQQMLFGGLGPEVVADFSAFDWNWALSLKMAHGWGKVGRGKQQRHRTQQSIAACA